MPEPAEDERDHDVDRAPAPAIAIAAERKKDVVAQPARKRDVPARPEFRDADRSERALEVGWETEAEHERRSDRAQRIPCEVAVHLEGERRGADPRVGDRQRS